MPIVNDSLSAIHCARCGVMFALPDGVIEARRRTGRKFFCPNGHRNWYHTERPLQERQADILRLHMEEQAEARAAEGKATDDLPETLKDKECPHCGKVYKSLACYQKHLKFAHQVEA